MALILSMSFVIADCKWKHELDCIASKAHIIGKLWHEWENIKHIICMRLCYMLCYSMQHSYIVYFVFCYYLWQWHISHLSQLSTLNFMHMHFLFYLPQSLLESIERSNHSTNQSCTTQCLNKLTSQIHIYMLSFRYGRFIWKFVFVYKFHAQYPFVRCSTQIIPNIIVVFLLVMNDERLSVLIFWMNWHKRWMNRILECLPEHADWRVTVRVELRHKRLATEFAEWKWVQWMDVFLNWSFFIKKKK